MREISGEELEAWVSLEDRRVQLATLIGVPPSEVAIRREPITPFLEFLELMPELVPEGAKLHTIILGPHDRLLVMMHRELKLREGIYDPVYYLLPDKGTREYNRLLSELKAERFENGKFTLIFASIFARGKWLLSKGLREAASLLVASGVFPEPDDSRLTKLKWKLRRVKPDIALISLRDEYLVWSWIPIADAP